ncbi:MAG: D-glycero-beta-D-manno-heptose-1,7-bisphosphate 7-phosphatase [Desulfobacterales bacterium CG23_combo_of_CG06-09_8_20_14_all_52_9]|nr:MAG: D-glycero-beta-D-manno-heptose-1,7-bisphosphate 7-phosphatase [Desulfobacterales bacterium CG23_combo_of_CG06-09_8_20_14_all_52_9]
MLKNVVFLDRDGVINEDSPNYIKSWEEFFFIPKSLEAIADLYAGGMELFVITNQSVVNRKLMTAPDLETLHRNMLAAVQSRGGKIRDLFYCPHLPEDGCTCRKPKPGLILTAQERYGIDLSTTFMVGDSEKDILCARAAGCRYAVLVRTGNGCETEKRLVENGPVPDYVAPDLYGAVQWILFKSRYG